MERDFEKHSDAFDKNEQSTYYAVYIPSDTPSNAYPYRHVFKDKQEAVCLAKTFKKSRFKSFCYYHEAVDFASNGQGQYDSSQDATNHTRDNVPVGEKPMAFRGPKSQDLVKLRKEIECGALTVIERTVWDNPRYLISSGDTPSILQEGSRYNALHVAAKCKNRSMVELILNTVSNINFVKLLYGDDDNQDLYERSKVLLDLYLNTPDKGLNETPLHFAVKFGAVDVVELLVSYPQCDRSVVNKFGKLPDQIICERCDSTPTKVKNKIAMLLQESFYVPVLRAENNCAPPVIGEPFAPTSPPVFNEDPRLPRIEIHAYAGPMSKEDADKFRKVWKTPPRSLRRQLHNKDLEKGLERVGRNLAVKHEVEWKEYWQFLDDFVDLTTSDGLEQLEQYFAVKVAAQFSTDSCTSTNSSIGSNALSPISDLCNDFKACTLSESSRNKRIQTAKVGIGDNPKPYTLLPDQFLHSDEINPIVCIDRTCEVFAHRISNDILNLLENDCNRTTKELLEIDVKQLQNVIASFMADPRFNEIDYRLVHFRVAYLIVTRLRELLVLEDRVNILKKMIRFLEMYNTEFDYFSSDDECGNYRQDLLNHNHRKLTSRNKQVFCLMQLTVGILHIDNRIGYDGESWTDGKPCSCIWPKPSIKRSSNKLLSRNFGVSQEDCVNRRLFNNKLDLASLSIENDCDILNKSRNLSVQTSDSEEDDDACSYYTAVHSPRCSDNSDSDEVFEDTVMVEEDIFIEGSVPTKMDYAVYNALTSGAKNKLNPSDYPNIYKWYHAISLYPECEKQSWGNSSIARCTINSRVSTSSPKRSNMSSSDMHHSPSSPLLRRIGFASPQHSLKVFKPNNSFNL